jgi:hypothetical protein
MPPGEQVLESERDEGRRKPRSSEWPSGLVTLAAVALTGAAAGRRERRLDALAAVALMVAAAGWIGRDWRLYAVAAVALMYGRRRPDRAGVAA